MKSINLLFLFSIVFFACHSDNQSETDKRNEKLILSKENQSAFTIVVDDKADSLTNAAALEIQSYFKLTAGIKIEISYEAVPDKKHIIIGKTFLDEQTENKLAGLIEDGFIIDITKEEIKIAGNDGKSTIYAAYTFIEEFLGCRLLEVNEEYIPTLESVELPLIEKTYEPDFAYRRTLFPGLKNEKYRYWHKLETLEEWGMFVHTFDDLVPPDKYYKEHPEYFSLVGEKRLADAQLCLGNPEVIELLKENLRREMEQEPEKVYWSVSQNDCYNYCECEKCKALYEKYGGVSGAYIYMSNELAKAFPDKQISTLAYQFTRSAPTNIKPLENVNVMFCSIECNRSMPLAEDKRSAGFVKDMEDWAKLTNNIFLWDYVVQFKNYFTPFPNFHVLQPNLQFFKKNNVSMMFQQGSGGSWSDLSNLKQYLISKLMWDTNADVDKIIKDYMEKYYGQAAPYIKEYFDLAHSSLKKNKENEWLDIYGFPMNYFDSYLTEENLIKFKELMDQAEESVKMDSIYTKRVLRTRLPVDFAYLDIALNKDLEKVTYVEKSEDAKTLKPEMVEYLNRFVEISELTNTNIINERSFTTKAYRDYVMRKLTMITKKNKAKGADIKAVTQPSEKYPVGGVKALTDGLFGDLDFHNNWLGYEGEDMKLIIDLKEPMEISKINMNFLKAVNSWVFLPYIVVVEVSDDGKNFRKVANIRNDNSDRTYLVKSIPYELMFSKTKAQYIRITALSLKQCPEWHRGYGKPSWIFVDEIVIE
jgi:hypothetical protein